MARLQSVTVTRTIQVRQYEPVSYAVTVERDEVEDASEVIQYAQRLIDEAVGDVRPPLLPARAGDATATYPDMPY